MGEFAREPWGEAVTDEQAEGVDVRDPAKGKLLFRYDAQRRTIYLRQRGRLFRIELSGIDGGSVFICEEDSDDGKARS